MSQHAHPFGQRPISQLLKELAIPAVIANVVNALYNIIDQIFIGQGIGYLGNAATNIAFPLTTICLALGLMIGIGAAAKFNLEMGKKQPLEAKKTIGTAIVSLFVGGVLLCLVMRSFLDPLLALFGATETILDYARVYTGVTSLGIPFLLFSLGANPLVRADGAAKYSMVAIMAGAVMNTLLDPMFIFAFGWGMAGAAWATVASQFVSAVILLVYFRRFQSVALERQDFVLNGPVLVAICSLGLASFIFQSSNVLVQIVTNQALKHYGAASIYGADIPIAVAGIVSKVNVIFVAIVIGIVQGSQPIISFNYGAGHYERVQETIRMVLKVIVLVSVVAWLGFELFPRQILGIFGSGTDLYFRFGIRYMQIFFLFACINGVQIFSSTFFPAIGMAKVGATISLVKQIGLIVPFLLLFPLFWGVEGLVFALPVADFLSFLLAGYWLYRQYQSLKGSSTIV